MKRKKERETDRQREREREKTYLVGIIGAKQGRRKVSRSGTANKSCSGAEVTCTACQKMWLHEML